MTMEPAISSSGLFPSRLLWPFTPLVLACPIVSGEALGTDGRPSELSSQVITANPLGNEPPATPSSVLEGDELTLRQKSSLGETLGGLPGASSTYFGPDASQPMIRGMDGDRTRLLRNGASTLDTSSLSYDHTVPEDPSSVERLEAVRGPAALLYGGNAIGGVANSSDNHIPSEPAGDIHGSGKLRYGGIDATRNRSGALETGDGNFILRVDAVNREFNDVRIPGYIHSSRQRQTDGDTGKHRVQNNDNRQDGGTAGGPYHWEHDCAGLSYSSYDSNYSLSVEDDVRLKMQQDHYVFASEIRNLEDPFTPLELDAVYTKYEYKETEDGEIDTAFKNEGYEGRIGAHHRPLGPLNGAIGAQFVNSRFSALGEEVFVPHTETNSTALFTLERRKLSDRLDLSFDTHLGHTRVDPDAKGNERSAENDDSRNFTTGSLPTDTMYKLTPIWSPVVTLNYTERAPVFYEPYASGPHAATGTYEVGDADADEEKAVSADLALCFDNGMHKGSVGVFYSRFSNYIGLLASDHHRNKEGEVVAASDGEALPEYLYSGVHTSFHGAEAQDHIHLLESPYGDFNLELSGDYTRAKNKDIGEPLPRTALLYLNIALIWKLQQWQARADVERAASQHRMSEGELSTDGYTTLGAGLDYNFDPGESRRLAFAKGTNLTSQVVCYASSTLRDRVPATGRGIEAGVKMAF